MTDSKKFTNNEILRKAVASLNLRFENAEVARATKESNGNISNFLHDKKPVSDAFLKTFAEAFKVDLREFGYTNGLVKAETKKPPPEEEADKYTLLHKIIDIQAKQIEVLQELLLKK